MPNEPDTPTHDPVDEPWLEQPLDELPRRPRRRLLGVGGHPAPLALIAVLLTACGFTGGVLVEKGQSSSGTSISASGFASRLAALGSGAGGGGSGFGGSSGLGGRAAAGGPSAFVGGAGARSPTIGQVSFISGDTLYVTDSEGDTVKVKASAASAISKTVKADVKGIHPGETVIVSGSADANGTIGAESIRIGQAGTGGGLGALFGGGGGSHARGSGSGGAGSGSGGGGSASRQGGGEPALFGK
jgi:hypothetical protein